MTILVVIHNSELAAEIASFLSRESWRTIVCPSVSGPQFLKEFSEAGLIITDLAPPVLELLEVQGQRLLFTGVPLVLLASRGHCTSFSTLLAGYRTACVAFDHGPEFMQRLSEAVNSLAEQNASPATLPTPAALPRSIRDEDLAQTSGSLPSKQVAADQAHKPRPSHHSRKAPHARGPPDGSAS